MGVEGVGVGSVSGCTSTLWVERSPIVGVGSLAGAPDGSSASVASARVVPERATAFIGAAPRSAARAPARPALQWVALRRAALLPAGPPPTPPLPPPPSP